MSATAAAVPQVPAGLARLPSGRHGLSREQVASHQRERLLQAVIAVVGRHGYEAATSKRIARAAGVSFSVFYRQFASGEDCLLEACDLSLPWLLQAITDGLFAEPQWTHGVAAGLGNLLVRLAGEPELARVWFIELRRADVAGARRHVQALETLARALRPWERRPSALSLSEQVMAGGVWYAIEQAVASGRAAELPELAADLHWYVLSCYLGPHQATLLAGAAA
jgi:AcrR family transcriptional regulator